MAQCTYETVFEAPIEAVFDQLSDIPNLEQTVSGITKVEMLSEGGVGNGTKWRETRIMMKREATEDMWIKEFDRPNRYLVEAESHGSHYLTEYKFSEVDKGTQVTMTFSATPQSFFAKLMSPMFFMMKGVVVKCFAADLDDFKTALKSGQSNSD